MRQLSRRISKTISISNYQKLTTNYTYDLASRLLSLAHEPIALSYTYTYDDVSNRKTLTDSPGLHYYNYDSLYRLTNAIHPNIPQEQYAYDPVGNRLGTLVDAGNRLLEDTNYTYSYDNNGNMISKINKSNLEQVVYTYDAENRLVSVTTPTSDVTYRYDGLGRRIEKNINGMITRYIYNNEDILLEYDGNNNITASYVHGPGIDEPLILDKFSQRYYYCTDALGSVMAITDSTGNIVQRYEYDSFGNIVSQQGSLIQPYTYTGREYDPETGLYYYRTRYYDSKIGRFLQEDPIWNVNLYAYVWNNPVNWVDPWGLSAWWDNLIDEIRDLLNAPMPVPIPQPWKTVSDVLTAAKTFQEIANAISEATRFGIKGFVCYLKRVGEEGPEVVENIFYDYMEYIRITGPIYPKIPILPSFYEE